MATVTLPYDHSRDPMNPGHLGEQIATNLGLASQPAVDISPAAITVSHPNVTAANTAAIQALVNAYAFDPAWIAPAGTPPANQAVLLAKAQAALASNATFLALAAPTQAQAVAQVQALTRQVNALVKLALGRLADTSGT